jgi:hypothetical protein
MRITAIARSQTIASVGPRTPDREALSLGIAER